MTTPFAAGTLWELIQQRTQAALQCGALQPIKTRQMTLPDRGVDFIVRQVSSLARKDKSRRLEAAAYSSVNPFLPYDPALYVSDVSDNHVCLLNKFNVIENHVLIVTRDFEHQENLLNQADFAAWLRCLSEFNSLGFYNGGEAAGASQTHKHLQLVPLPLADGRYEFPFVSVLSHADAQTRNHATSVWRCGLPFSHAIVTLDANQLRDRTAAAYLLSRYEDLLSAVGIGTVGNDHVRQTAPYNVLISKQWMWLVPRSREFYQSISVNGLGFAGSLFVRDSRQFELLRHTGPMEVLRSVSEPY